MPVSADEIAEVLDDLRYGHPETRKAAAIRLGRIRDSRVIPHLIKAALNDDYKWTRISAMQSLQWIADEAAVEPLIQIALEDTEVLVRKSAIEILGNFKNKRAIPALEIIAGNPNNNPDLIKAASVALQIIQEITPGYSMDRHI